MSRIPPAARSDLATEQQEIHDDLSTFAGKMFGPNGEKFYYKHDADDALIGPFPFFMAAPDTGRKLFDFMLSIAKIPGLPRDARETAILACGAHWKAVYELYSHQTIAENTVGMPHEQVEAIKAGKKPDDLNEQCSIAYDIASYLIKTPGPLPRELWERSQRVLGHDGTVALIHYIGNYAYVCIVLNATDTPVPAEANWSL